MRKTLLSLLAGTASFAVLSSAAFAADLPARRAPPVPYVAVPVFTWTGFYVGVNAGGAFSTHDNHDDFNTNTAFVGATPLTGFSAVTSRNNDRSGFAGGGQIGYNYQIGSWVIGVEADIQGTSFGNNRDDSFFGSNGSGFATVTPNDGLVAASVAGAPGNVAFFNNQFSSRRNLDWFGTARGRIGYAWDRLLVYGTGGVAFTDDNNNDRVFGSFGSGAAIPAPFFVSGAAAAAGAAVAPSFVGVRRNNDNVGYAVGGGLEYAFTPNFTGKIEGLYVNFGHNDRGIAGNSVIGVTNTGAPVTASTVGFRNRDDDFAVVRAGLNYKFNVF
jgi:outer membrane immunogenic protein